MEGESASPDWLDLDGTANTRDLGGLPTIDRRRTVRRRLLRSDNLEDLSPGDVRRLIDDVGVRTIVDLRTQREVAATGRAPLDDHALLSVNYLPLSTAPIQRPNGAVGAPVRTVGFANLYFGFLRERPESLLAALRLIAHSEGATLVHCTAGKDRTGVVVALALAAADVEPAAIVADYAVSAERFDAVITRLSRGAQGKELSQAAALEHTPRPASMEGFLALLAGAGGASGWLVAHGWTTTDQSALRRKLLED